MNTLMSNDTLAHVLLHMHKTVKYNPVAQWIVPSAGRGMMRKFPLNVLSLHGK